MKTIIVSLLMAGLIYPASGEAQTDDGVGTSEETGLGSGHSPFNHPLNVDVNVNDEEKALDFGQTPTNVPIDGGLSVLLIAGAAYGAKKIVSGRLKNKVAREG